MTDFENSREQRRQTREQRRQHWRERFANGEFGMVHNNNHHGKGTGIKNGPARLSHSGGH